jgi:hypothetical protein
MKRINILLVVLLIGIAIYSISTRTNTGPVRVESNTAVRTLPLSPTSAQPDTTVRVRPVSTETNTDWGISEPSQDSTQPNTALSIASLSPTNTQPDTTVEAPKVIAKKTKTAGGTSTSGAVNAQPSADVKTAVVSPVVSVPTDTAVKTPPAITETKTAGGTSTSGAGGGAQGKKEVKTARVSKQDSTAVKTSPVSEQDNTAVKTSTASEQASTAVKTSPVSTQPYSPGTTSTQTESSIGILYVDGSIGSDITGNGSSAKPWKTIKKAVGYLKPGDTLSIMGGTYKERITITKSGSATGRITIGAFGNGEVIIDCSPSIGTWTPYTETTIKGIYKATCSFKPTAVVVNEQPIFPAFSITGINENEWYYDSTARIIYLCPAGAIKPTSSNVGVISDDAYSDGVLINNAHYVTLYGLTVRYAGGRGISILGNYNEIRRCNVKFNGHTGINMFNYGSTRSTDIIVAENHIYHNFLRNWPRGRYKWGSWGGGAISHGTSRTQYIGNISHKNGGEGLLAYSGSGGTIWRNNIVYDNWSVNVYIDNQPNGIIEGNTIFSTNPDPHDLYHNGDSDPGDNKNLRRLRPEGIMIADEDYGRTPPANLNNVRIVNNIISGCRRGINHYGEAAGSGLKNFFVSKNTIIVPDAKGAGESFVGIRVPYNDGNNQNVVFENNLIYATNPSTYLLYMVTDPAVTKASDITFSNITFKGNTWYHAAKANPFHVGPDYHTAYDIDFNKWETICKANCIADKYKNITTQIKLVLDKIADIFAANP